MIQNIRKIEDSGRKIVLDDNSKWEASSFDAFKSRMWMALDKVEVSIDKMTNLSRRNETIHVRRAT